MSPKGPLDHDFLFAQRDADGCRTPSPDAGSSAHEAVEHLASDPRGTGGEKVENAQKKAAGTSSRFSVSKISPSESFVGRCRLCGGRSSDLAETPRVRVGPPERKVRKPKGSQH